MTRECDPRGDQSRTMTPEILAQLGTGTVAYVREIRSEDLSRLFPGAPRVAGGMKLWALLNADGTPIVVADSREAALANAFENELHTVSVH
ncbi:DUF1150 family protein [Polymorphum gilvum]|uniref:NADH oxidase n=1 Tax=Polymorphum gilvum (strain LMG 25793 / CGMCC 1.9160 / SL003B-26A1) TaxID=991905 RepID=F2J6V7_POLGS|nr:DUF1150 domain-containing protein [Polymorphum gilvum]ADZ72590.1 NADH oxidase [Polymorphum gilvum SL003B-26A1]